MVEYGEMLIDLIQSIWLHCQIDLAFAKENGGTDSIVQVGICLNTRIISNADGLEPS